MLRNIFRCIIMIAPTPTPTPTTLLLSVCYKTDGLWCGAPLLVCCMPDGLWCVCPPPACLLQVRQQGRDELQQQLWDRADGRVKARTVGPLATQLCTAIMQDLDLTQGKMKG